MNDISALEAKAEESRLLAASDPAAEPELTVALNNLSNRLAEVGRREEALAAIEESVAVYRRLAAVNPAAWEPDLARALSNLSNRLMELGRETDASTAAVESADLQHRLEVGPPDS